jgi:type I restriction enzyme, S subunit
VTYLRHDSYLPVESAWLQEVPAGWRYSPLWPYFNVVEDRAGKDADTLELLSVSQSLGVLPRSAISDKDPRADDLSNYRRCRAGDVVINRMSAYQGAVGVSPQEGIVSPDYLVLRCADLLRPEFLVHLLKSSGVIGEIILRLRGIGTPGAGAVRTPRIGASELGRISIPLPSAGEQDAILTALDRETAQIDDLIAKQERLVELLAEKRQATITHAITRGLDATAATKPSGTPWLGDIPAHWDIAPVSASAVLIQTGPFGSQIHAEDYVDGGTPLINPSHLISGKIVPNWKVAVSDEKAVELRRHALQKGDLVVARRGELGRNAVVSESDEGFLCGTGSLLVRLSSSAYVPGFFSLVFAGQHTRDRLALSSIGATMDNLNAGLVASLRLVRPPKAEQQSILNHLKRVTHVLDETTEKATRSIALLRERRSALISAAVTGKVDVREGSA